MGKLLSSLQLQTFLILWIIYIVSAAPYSKYGRTCKDIGCLPRETCVMSYDSCSFNQQEGSNCGRYPTCQKRTDAQTPQQNSGPAPTPNTNTNIWNIATPTTTRYTTTTTRPTTTTTTTRRAWTTKAPFYNPSNPSYNGGGSYYGNRYGNDDDNSNIGGSFGRTTTTTRRPSTSSSSGGFNSFLSGLSGFLSGDVGKLIQGALSNRGGSSPSGGSSGGGFFDTRPLTENKNYRGGLFSENTNQGATRTSGTSEYGGYPITRENAPSAPPLSSNQQQPTASHGNYGWKLS